MKRLLTAVAASAVAALTMLPAASLAGATSEPRDPYPALPRGMAGVDGEVTRIYLAVLDRAPDDAGLDYWSDERQRGVPLSAVVGSFRTSPEFELRFGSMLDAPVEVWVETMYQRVLGRSSDAAGKAYWTDLIDSGVSTREALIIHFADSVEYRVATGTGLEGFADRVEKSRQRYAALGDDYSYGVEFQTAFANGSTTELEVVDGIVTQRAYEAWHTESGARVVDDAWTEVDTDLGSHVTGAPVHTVDQVHAACRQLLDSLDRRQHELVLYHDDDGLMTTCGGIEPELADSPGKLVSISEFTTT